MKPHCGPPFTVFLFLSTILGLSTSFFVTTPRCGTAFYGRSGTFSSPAYSAPYGSNTSETCEWRITAGADEKITLNITDIDIIKTPDCRQGSVEIRDGYWYSSPLLGKVCGHSRLDPVTSTGNKMYISYNYNNPQRRRGFIANYEAICGGDLFVENTTQFATPDYPGKYPLNKKCIWRIVVPDYRLAVLTFQSFDVEHQKSCLYDYVEIRDGLDENGDLIGVFCGIKSSMTVFSKSSYLYVKFVSDISIQKAGFVATVQNDYDRCLTEANDCAQICIKTVGSFKCGCQPGYRLKPNGKDCEVSCGETMLTAPTGIIRSPLYPNYPANSRCVWEITARRHDFIKINFTAFDVEGNSNNTIVLCDKDRLKIYAKLGDVFRLQATYCGSEIPPPILYQTNALRLVFESDSTLQKPGFSLNYVSRLNMSNIDNCVSGSVPSIDNITCQCANGFVLEANKRDCGQYRCNHEINTATGYVQSVNYPRVYDNNLNCKWWFKTSPGHKIKLTFLSFTLESSGDRVTIYDGLTVGNMPLLGAYAGTTLPPAIISSTNGLYMTFTTDSSRTYKGFQARYSAVCGGPVTASSEEKYITSHAEFGYGNYSNSAICDWVINATSGYVITIDFLTFQLQNCNGNDYVEILDGPNTNSTPPLARFCGSTLTPGVMAVTSTNNVVTVRFRSDSTITDKGFSLTYKAVADGRTTLLTDTSSNSSPTPSYLTTELL